MAARALVSRLVKKEAAGLARVGAGARSLSSWYVPWSIAK